MVGKSNDTPGRQTRRSGLVPLLAIVAGCSVVALMAFPGLDPKSGAAPVPIAKPRELDIYEMQDLIAQLGHSDLSKREQAYDTLFEIGRLVLERYPYANLSKNPKAVPLAFKLYRAIQKKHGLETVKYRGLEFTPVGDVDWKLPKPGKRTKIEMGIKIVNKTVAPVRIPAHVVRIQFLSADFKLIAPRGGCDTANTLIATSALIGVEKEGTIRDVRGELEAGSEVGCCTFQGSQLLTWFFMYENLKPGGYFIRYTLANDYLHLGKIDPPFWTGEVRTGWVAIEIE